MTLHSIYARKEDIPEQFAELFSERNGQFELTGIQGIKTEADVERLQRDLRKEREDHKATKAALGKFGDLDADEVFKKLDRIEELEAAAGDKIDEDKINEMVEARVKTRLAPVERENKQLKERVDAQEGQITEFKREKTTRSIHDALRSELTTAKVLPEAFDDALMLAERIFEVREDDGAVVVRDNVGFTPGIGVKDFISDIREKRPHWWGASAGGGANPGGSGGGMGNNPWSADSWNMTAQGQVVREKGLEAAKAMAQQAGSSLGSPFPPKGS